MTAVDYREFEALVRRVEKLEERLRAVPKNEPMLFESTQYVTETYKTYVMVRDAVFGGRTRVDFPQVRKTLSERLRLWKPWQIIATPILVQAQGSWTLAKKPDLDVLLRDGTHARTYNGQTFGGRDFIMRAMQSIDGTVLDSRLAEIARQAGIIDELVRHGVKVPSIHGAKL